MNHRPRWEPGNYLLIDDMSGFVTRRKRSRMQWNNLIVNEKDWEPEQPQNYLRAIPDDMTVPDPRPDVAPVYLPQFLITQENGSAILAEGDPSTLLAQEPSS